VTSPRRRCERCCVRQVSLPLCSSMHDGNWPAPLPSTILTSAPSTTSASTRDGSAVFFWGVPHARAEDAGVYRVRIRDRELERVARAPALHAKACGRRRGGASPRTARC
jgi:hypothetical protein